MVAYATAELEVSGSISNICFADWVPVKDVSVYLQKIYMYI